MNSALAPGWRSTLVIDDDAVFGGQLVEALRGLRVTTEREASFDEMERRLAENITKYDVVLLDLGIPEGRDPSDRPVLDKGIQALRWLKKQNAGLSVIAYTFRHLTDEEKARILEVGVLDLLLLEPTPRTNGDKEGRLEGLLARILQKDEECRKIASMLHERSWAHALLDVWGVGISVVEWDSRNRRSGSLNGRILFQDERHTSLTRGREPVRFGVCYKEWHGYGMVCSQCAVALACKNNTAQEAFFADRIGDEFFYSFVRAVPLASSEEGDGRPFAAMEAVVPLSRGDPLIEGMPLRYHVRLLCAAICCASEASHCTVLLASDPFSEEPRISPVVSFSAETGLVSTSEPDMPIRDDYWCDKAWHSNEILVRNPEDDTPDTAGAKLCLDPPTSYGLIYLSLSPSLSRKETKPQKIGLLRLTLRKALHESRLQSVLKSLNQGDVLFRELVEVLSIKGEHYWEKRDTREALRKKLTEVAKKCSFENVRIYRTTHGGAWLWGYLNQGSPGDGFEEANFLAREDEATYSALLHRIPSIRADPCGNHRLRLTLPPASSRIEFPVFANENNELLACKVVADRGQHGVDKSHLAALTAAMATFAPILRKAFSYVPPARLPSERTSLIHWSDLQARVALSRDPDEAIAILIQSLARQTGATSAYIRIERDSKLYLSDTARVGAIPQTVRPVVSLAEAYSLSARTFRSGSRSIWNHADRNPEYGSLSSLWLTDEEAKRIHASQKSAGIFPIVGAGEYVGTLALHSDQDPTFFDKEVIRAVDEVAADIGRIIRHQRLLAAARDSAEIYRQLSHRVAHEIINPCAAQGQFLSSALELCKTAGDSKGVTRLLELAIQQQERIRKITSEIYELGKHPQLALQRVVLGPALNEIWNVLKAADPSRESVSMELIDGHNLVVWADPQLLQIALDALLINAVEYGAKKSKDRIVTCTIEGPFGAFEPPEVQMRSQYVCLYIEDSGSGIAPSMLSSLFHPFNAKATQTGLGLPIAKQKVEAMNGVLKYAPKEPPQGARFLLTLPTPPQPN